MSHSTVPAGVALQAHVYLAQGGVENLRPAARLPLRHPADDGLRLRAAGGHPDLGRAGVPRGPRSPRTTARASRSSTTAPSTWRATPPTSRRCATRSTPPAASPCRSTARRCAPPEPELLELLGTADALVTTVLAAGGAVPATVTAGGADDTWNVAHLAALDIPILQGLCLTSSRAQWSGNDDGMSPLDVATQVAVPGVRRPHHHGSVLVQGDRRRGPDLLRRRSRTLRPGRGAGRASRPAAPHRARGQAGGAGVLGLPDQARPHRQRRRSGHPGQRRRAARARCATPATTSARCPGVDAGDGDALIHALIERGGQDPDWLTEGQLAGNPIRVSAKDYRAWFATLPSELADAVVEHWGPPPGELFVDRSRDPDGEIVIAAMQSGNIVLMVQPPRGFGENPVAIYHDPDLPPSHHYLAAYRWLDDVRQRLRRRRRRAPRQARQPGVAARQDAGHVGGVRHRRRARRPAADLPVPGQRSGRGHPGQAPRARRPGRPPDPADGARRELRRHRPTRAAARRALQHRRAGPGQAARHPPADLDADAGREDGPRPRPGGPARRGRLRRHAAARRRLAVRDQGRPDPRRPAHPRPGARRRGRTRPGAGHPAGPPAVRRRADRARVCGRRSAWPRTAPTTGPPSTRPRHGRANWSPRWPKRDWDARRGRRHHRRRRRSPRCCASRPPRWCRGCGRPIGEIDQILRALDGGFIPAGPVGFAAARPGQRAADRPQLLLRRPQGGAVAAGLGNRCGPGGFAAGALPRRPRRVAAVGRACRCGAPRRCAPPATTSPKCLRCSAFGRCGTTRRAASSTWSRSTSPSSAAPASTSRSASRASSATPSRTS